MPSRGRAYVAGLALVVGAGGAIATSASFARPAVGVPSCDGRHWVGAWSAAPSDARDGDGKDAEPPLDSQTVRMVVHPSIGGAQVRVRLSHRYGHAAALIGHATIAVRLHDAAVVPGSVRSLRFHGVRDVTLQPGQDVVSDPVSLRFRAGQDLLVSLHVPGVVQRPTEHAWTNETNYLSASRSGDHASDVSGEAFPSQPELGTSAGWYFLSGVDVLAPRRTAAVVAFGDSITDGFQSGLTAVSSHADPLGRNVRYPDFLSARLRAGGTVPQLSVLNSGITGNRVLSDARPRRPYGEAALDRFGPDAMWLPGASDIIVLEGINDLRTNPYLTAEELTQALFALVREAQLDGLTVHLGTLTPQGGSRTATAQSARAVERRRQAVNRWIRTSGVADSVVDFDRAVRDPRDPSRLRPTYDSGDHLHPNSAGYRAMARAVPLADLTGTRCR